MRSKNRVSDQGAELLRDATERARPVDVDALVKQGVVAKVAGQYRVLDWNALPPHVRAQVVQVDADGHVEFRKGGRDSRL